MIKIQVRLTSEQALALRRRAKQEGKSVAELIRMSVDIVLRSSKPIEQQVQRRKAIVAAGKLLGGPEDLSADHGRYLADSEYKHAG